MADVTGGAGRVIAGKPGEVGGGSITQAWPGGAMGSTILPALHKPDPLLDADNTVWITSPEPEGLEAQLAQVPSWMRQEDQGEVKPWYAVRMAADRVGEVLIYGHIADARYGEYSKDAAVSPKDLEREIKALGQIDRLNVRVFSYGGSAMAGAAMYAIINRLKAKTVAYVEGIAASAATLPVVACDEVVISEVGEMLIHKPKWGAYGDDEDMLKSAQELQTMNNVYAQAYAKKSGKPITEILALMKADRLLSAREAVELGLADRMDEEVKPVAAACLAGDSAMMKSEAVQAWAKRHGAAMAAKKADLHSGETIEQEDEAIMTLEELKQKHPEMYTQAVLEGVTQERARMKALDELPSAGHEALMQAAKYGDKPMGAPEVAMEMIKAGAGKPVNNKPGAYMAAMVEEGKDMEGVGGDAPLPAASSLGAKAQKDLDETTDELAMYMGAKPKQG